MVVLGRVHVTRKHGNTRVSPAWRELCYLSSTSQLDAVNCQLSQLYEYSVVTDSWWPFGVWVTDSQTLNESNTDAASLPCVGSSIDTSAMVSTQVRTYHQDLDMTLLGYGSVG